MFHFQEKRVDEFFELIEENISKVNHYFKTVFRTFLRHKQYIKNVLETDYSNAKLEASNKACFHHSEHKKRGNLSGSL